MKKKSFWLNYDLGLRGNYEGLFTFLDNNNAIECGSGLSYFTYEFEANSSVDKIVDKVKDELNELVSPSKNDRIYIIWKDDNKVKGRFLFGKRKAAPWVGYTVRETEKENDEIS